MDTRLIMSPREVTMPAAILVRPMSSPTANGGVMSRLAAANMTTFLHYSIRSSSDTYRTRYHLDFTIGVVSSMLTSE